ncbi:hypothetical protein [Oceanirhabdus sp. W0125-5]|uniref:hypothetical protein n=1 Tax=Oceanirhabdus sp. W0125-5 TaxID=2999116 RepID=UPI0022F2EAAE|nr:hypothetical protein [Oceanirhabdus sp. W0125-5]WBW95232.1 hypothetical protein OW730_16230 [Oceanirhabdus sp. W0125-5]
MKINNLLNMYDFHDSVIKNIIYISNKKEITFEINLCNWRQLNYKDNDLEIIKLKLVFTGIEAFKTAPEYFKFDNEEILDVSCKFDEKNNNYFVKFVVYGKDDVILIKFYAKESVISLEQIE